MSRRLTGSIIAAAVLLALLAHVTGAHASEWQPPIEGGVMLLGFGAVYPGGMHRGVDIRATAGALVTSPAAGVVAFAGQVPADGGGTCGAVTVELADGRRMSLLPFDGMTVTTGDAVSAGDALGHAAASGDDSSSEAHLHVGLRSGDLYLDPGELTAVGPVSAEVPAAVPAATPDSGQTVLGAGGSAAIVSAPAAAPAAVPVPGPSAVSEQAGSAASLTSIESAIPAPSAGRSGAAVEAALRDAGVPEASALVPNVVRATVRDRPHVAVPAGRNAAGAVLALGVGVAAAGLVLVRRAAPVHVD
ncbi:MAG: M23 family metallopeptidase [Coriobacteriia bacterium]|nr:M23 family metallopeptidase [Coriobacteriia bacterium]